VKLLSVETGMDFGIVLMTPDDKGYAERDGARAIQARARQNVVLEMGMLLAALGRSRVVVLRKGHLELPLRRSRHHLHSVQPSCARARTELVDRLREAGFNLAADAITRASS
jgi:hypothetical protein